MKVLVSKKPNGSCRLSSLFLNLQCASQLNKLCRQHMRLYKYIIALILYYKLHVEQRETTKARRLFLFSESVEDTHTHTNFQQ